MPGRLRRKCPLLLSDLLPGPSGITSDRASKCFYHFTGVDGQNQIKSLNPSVKITFLFIYTTTTLREIRVDHDVDHHGIYEPTGFENAASFRTCRPGCAKSFP